VAVGFIDGGNRSTQRKPQVTEKLSHKFVSSTPRNKRDSNLQL